MRTINAELCAIADHLQSRKELILREWQAAVHADSALSVGASLSKVDFLDHVPALLDTFERELRANVPAEESENLDLFPNTAASHGLKRWQQGYDLGELVRELGRLNECIVDVLDDYTQIDATVSHQAISAARHIWANFSTIGVEESVRQYAVLQREEAAGQAKDLETALAALRTLETQRGDLWQQAAHDLRGNLGVVANASIGLTHSGLPQPARDGFVRILIRNITSLHRLLDDVTELARLQAGRETRRLEHIDVTPILQDLCEGIRPVAEQKQLFLHCEGPAGLGVYGDTVKLRRIAQNLILNAVKFTQKGGITVTWGDSGAEDSGHWMMSIADTGPGFPSESGQPIATALAGQLGPIGHPRVIDSGAGEGLGLSIVKRLCEILGATLERRSIADRGTTFKVLFPRSYEHSDHPSPIRE